MPPRVTVKRLMEVYGILRSHNGHLGWWPGTTRLEVIVGAILTQNTNWANVEKALGNLKRRRWLSLRALREAAQGRLAEAVRPSGYFRQKARKIKAFLALLDDRYGGSLARMSRVPVGELREQLLSVWGIGPETADSILLYAFDKPVFVVDTYTGRVMKRHGWAPDRAGYGDLQRMFAESLPEDIDLWKDFHAQIIWVGKHHCGTTPRCEGCPLKKLLPHGRPLEIEKPL